MNDGWQPFAGGGGSTELLWTLAKDASEVRALLLDHSRDGWEMRLMLNGQRWYSQRYPTRHEALTDAARYRNRLETQGWSVQQC